VKAKIAYALVPAPALTPESVTDAEAEALYKKDPSAYQLPERRKGKYLLVETALLRTEAAKKVLDADVAGATLVAGNTAGNWYPVVYGDTENDVALAAATSSIRWSDANNATTPEVVLTLENLELGAEYKAQLIFGENCCNRGFDVFLDGTLIVKDFNPGNVHGGIGNRKQTALITRLHFARDTKLTFRFDGRGATSAFTDHNAILNAVTLEKVAPKTDTDSDGLADEWEKLYFGNLTAQAAAGAAPAARGLFL